MIIVRLNGGLGNQMFQIALGKKLEHLNKIVQYDINSIESRVEVSNMTKSYDVFDISLDIADSKDIEKLSDMHSSICDRIRRKIFGCKSTYYSEKRFGDEDKNIYDFDNAYLDGYWQSVNYFNDCSKIIVDLFKFKPFVDNQNKEYENIILSSENSVSIHVRLGDYCTKENVKDFGNICTDEYYSNSIRYFQNRFKKVNFCIFSNDIKYTERFLNKDNFFVINCNDEKNAWKDMYLMSICKNNIIANSSFSWWGAWLNRNNDKIVIAPQKWINSREMKNICPKDWVRL